MSSFLMERFPDGKVIVCFFGVDETTLRSVFAVTAELQLHFHKVEFEAEENGAQLVFQVSEAEKFAALILELQDMGIKQEL